MIIFSRKKRFPGLFKTRHSCGTDERERHQGNVDELAAKYCTSKKVTLIGHIPVCVCVDSQFNIRPRGTDEEKGEKKKREKLRAIADLTDDQCRTKVSTGRQGESACQEVMDDFTPRDVCSVSNGSFKAQIPPPNPPNPGFCAHTPICVNGSKAVFNPSPDCRRSQTCWPVSRPHLLSQPHPRLANSSSSADDPLTISSGLAASLMSIFGS